MAKKEHDPVYLVIGAVGIGLGFSGGAASGKILYGLIGGIILGVIGEIVYYFIKRSKKPKTFRRARDKFRMR